MFSEAFNGLLFLEEKGKHLVPLKEVEKPITGLQTMRKVEREEELKQKFSKLSEEEHVLKSYEADKKKVIFCTMLVATV